MRKTHSLTKTVSFQFPVQVLKFADEAGEFHIVGYAATTDFDLQGDIITEDALKASSLDLIKNSTVLLNHDLKLPIGKVTKAEFDRHGLLIDALISKTEPDIIQKIKEGVLNKFSIRGQVLDRERKFSAEHDRMVNVINRMSLLEVSLVSVPANPEAKAIGWYISKALEEPAVEGGNVMSEKATVEKATPEAPPVQPPVVEPQASKPDGYSAPAEKQVEPAKQDVPKGADPFAEMQMQKPSEIHKAEAGIIKAQLEPVFSLLDKIIALGGQAGTLSRQIKTILNKLAGEPVAADPAPAAITKDELDKLIAGEVQRQVETSLKAMPTLRKGLVQTDTGAEEVRKQFESLPPEKKLRAALALQEHK
jgi:HK97 family phage prohead protease